MKPLKAFFKGKKHPNSKSLGIRLPADMASWAKSNGLKHSNVLYTVYKKLGFPNPIQRPTKYKPHEAPEVLNAEKTNTQ